MFGKTAEKNEKYPLMPLSQCPIHPPFSVSHTSISLLISQTSLYHNVPYIHRSFSVLYIPHSLIAPYMHHSQYPIHPSQCLTHHNFPVSLTTLSLPPQNNTFLKYPIHPSQCPIHVTPSERNAFFSQCLINPYPECSIQRLLSVFHF